MYDDAKRGFEDSANTKEKGVVLTKDDKVHGSLLVIQELIRNSSSEGEVNFYSLDFDPTCQFPCRIVFREVIENK